MKQIIPKVFWAFIVAMSVGIFFLMPSISHAGDDIKVIVPKAMRTCQVDADCAFVETRCSSCCDYVGINKKFVKQYYDQNYSDACAEYKGPVCDCIAPLTVPVCKEGMCELVETPQKKSFPIP
jgi:hypothetical protein